MRTERRRARAARETIGGGCTHAAEKTDKYTANARNTRRDLTDYILEHLTKHTSYGCLCAHNNTGLKLVSRMPKKKKSQKKVFFFFLALIFFYPLSPAYAKCVTSRIVYTTPLRVLHFTISRRRVRCVCGGLHTTSCMCVCKNEGRYTFGKVALSTFPTRNRRRHHRPYPLYWRRYLFFARSGRRSEKRQKKSG